MKNFQAIAQLVLLLVGALAARAQAPAGIPEPGLFIYGPVVNLTNNLPVQATAVSLQISGAGDAATVPTTIVSVNGTFYFVARVPFETRAVGGSGFTKTAGTFDLKINPATYTRTASCDGLPATFLSSTRGTLGSFTFGGADRGVVENVVLGVKKAPINNNPDFVFNIEPKMTVNPNGSLVFRWPSQAGLKFVIYRTDDLNHPFVAVSGDLAATPPSNSFTDPLPPGAKQLFYKIQAHN